MKTNTIVLFTLLLIGCSTERQIHNSGAVGNHAQYKITPAERAKLRLYCVLRRKVTDLLALPEDATVEDIRPLAAEFLGLDRSASWEQMIEEPRVRKVLTEPRRKNFAKLFGVSPKSTWVEIGMRIELLRKQM